MNYSFGFKEKQKGEANKAYKPKQSIVEQKCAKKCLLNRAYKPQRRTSSLVLVFSSNPNIIQVPSVGMQSSRKQA